MSEAVTTRSTFPEQTPSVTTRLLAALVRIIGHICAWILPSSRASVGLLRMILQPKRLGRTDAHRATNDVRERTPGSGSARITQYCDQLLRRAAERLSHSEENVRRRFRTLDITSVVASLDADCKRAERDVHSQAATSVQQLVDSLHLLQAKEHEYSAFQKTARLARLHKTPRLRLFLVLSIVALWALLTLSITSWRSDGVEIANLQSSMGWALVFSLLPAIVGAGLIRKINHVSAANRLLGYFAWLLLLFSLPIAAYLCYSGLTLPAIERSLDGVLSLIDSLEWTPLLGLSGCGLVAAAIGYCMDDPYPGYGATGRELATNRAAFNKQCADARQTVIKKFDDLISRIQTVRVGVETQIDRYDRAQNDYQAQRAKTAHYRTTVIDAGNTLLREYREGFEAAYPSCEPDFAISHYSPALSKLEQSGQDQIYAELNELTENVRSLGSAVETSTSTLNVLCDSYLGSLDMSNLHKQAGL